MATEDHNSSDWEELSSNLSYSSSDEEPAARTDTDSDSDSGWFVVKKKKEQKGKQESDDDDDVDMERFYSPHEDSDHGDLTFLKAVLGDYIPESMAEEKFSLDYIEQNVFPRLPTRTLLHLRPASARWARWISSPFFIHTHSLTARSLSGFFFHNSTGSPSFVSLDVESCSLPDPSLSFLPEPVHIKASNYGLICCRGRRSLKYYICNPTTAQWTLLPPPAHDHGDDPAVVIVMQEPITYNFDADYFLACAYEIFEGVFGFETFSSEKWEWRNSNEIVAAEKIVSGSGVSVVGAAYWRTTMQSVVAFDPVADTWHEMICPVVTESQWEIGEIGRKLCVVNVGHLANVEVRVWEGGNSWRKAEVISADEAVPLRAQGEREVVMWDPMRKAVTVTDVEWGSERVVVESGPGYCADFLPFVSSLVHVKRGPQT